MGINRGPPPPEGGDARLQLARQIAAQSRDAPELRGDAALVNQWREVSKPRKGGMIKPQPPGSKVDFPGLFQRWLQDRGLEDDVTFDREEQGWRVYRYTKEPVVSSQPDWEQAFHGTWWYAVWLILHTGIFLESNNRDLGHDFWEPGVYCSPVLDTGLWYARPQILFNDGVYHRIIFEVRVDPKRRQKNRKRGGVQWVFPCAAVSLHAVWVRVNAPPANGEERVLGWQPELEALPPGVSHPAAIVNPRTEPWPHIVDEFAWDFEGESNVPPWMRSGDGKKSKAAAKPAAQSYGTHQFGGLYGHWLKELSQLKSSAGSGSTTKGMSSSKLGMTSKPKPHGSLARVEQKQGIVAMPSLPAKNALAAAISAGKLGHMAPPAPNAFAAASAAGTLGHTAPPSNALTAPMAEGALGQPPSLAAASPNGHAAAITATTALCHTPSVASSPRSITGQQWTGQIQYNAGQQWMSQQTQHNAAQWTSARSNGNAHPASGWTKPAKPMIPQALWARGFDLAKIAQLHDWSWDHSQPPGKRPRW